MCTIRDDCKKVAKEFLGKDLSNKELNELEEAMNSRFEMYQQDYDDTVDIEALFNEDFADGIKENLQRMGLLGKQDEFVTPYGKKVFNMVKEQPLVAQYYDNMIGASIIPLKEYQENTELQKQVFALLNGGTFFDDADEEQTPHNFAMELSDVGDGTVNLIVRDVIGFY